MVPTVRAHQFPDPLIAKTLAGMACEQPTLSSVGHCVAANFFKFPNLCVVDSTDNLFGRRLTICSFRLPARAWLSNAAGSTRLRPIKIKNPESDDRVLITRPPFRVKSFGEFVEYVINFIIASNVMYCQSFVKRKPPRPQRLLITPRTRHFESRFNTLSFLLCG